MQKFLRYLKRSIWALCVLIVGIVGFFAWLISDPLRFDPPWAVYYQFVFLTFLDGRAYYDGVVWRQAGPVRVDLQNISDPNVLKQVDDYLVTLEKYSGLEIRRIASDEPANVVVLHKPREDLARMAQPFGPKAAEASDSARQSCFGIEGEDSTGRPRVLIGIASELSKNEIAACRSKQLTRALGLMGDLYTFSLMSSVMNSIFRTDQLSMADKFVIRTLYDERISPRMKSEAVQETAWKVLNELFSNVVKSGESALLHPKYVTRANR